MAIVGTGDDDGSCGTSEKSASEEVEWCIILISKDERMRRVGVQHDAQKDRG